jgi:O-antigen/teichoic acid export membrane protein
VFPVWTPCVPLCRPEVGVTLLTDRLAIARLFGSAVLTQLIVSIGNFAVGLILIRLTSNAQYGTYVLVMTTVLLLAPLQASFIQPGMLSRIARGDQSERAAVVGGLYGAQRRAIGAGAVAALAVVLILRASAAISDATALVAGAGVVAVAASLFREFFRIVLMGYRRPADVFKSDVLYIVMIVCGAWLSAQTSAPAAAAAFSLAVSAVCAGAVSARSLWLHEPWDTRASPRIFREIAALGTWSAIGSAISWSFTQGYGYIVAAVLNVGAVAGINATRLILMPVGVVSNGISILMLPTAYIWLEKHGPVRLLRMLAFVAAGLACVTISYGAVAWVLRDWIFLEVFKKTFPDRDRLLLLWTLLFTLICIRDEAIYLLIACGRFKLLAALTFTCAVLALTCAYLLVREIGAAGALIGMSIGEGVNLIGIGVLSAWEVRRLRSMNTSLDSQT